MATGENKALKERERIKRLVSKSTMTMMTKNEERGNCSGDVGLFGLFLEVRTMYLRLRSLVWDKGPPVDIGLMLFSRLVGVQAGTKTKKYKRWKADVQNALEDLRNYTILAELALEDNNIKGAGDDSELSKRGKNEV